MRRRERLLALAAGLAVAAWGLDAAAVGPLSAHVAALGRERDRAAGEAAEARALADRSARIAGEWRARHAAGLLDGDEAARARLQEALAAAARASGCAIESVSGGQRVAAAAGESFDLVRLSASCQGSLAQATALLAALAAAPLPLAVERCELAARDARKDELDLALTLSTRIVAAARRAGRQAAAAATPWTPAAAPASAAAVLAARPFSTDRRAPRAAARDEAPAAPGGWALVGVLGRGDGGATALLRHLGDGREQALAAGGAVDGATVAAVRPGGIELAAADGATRAVAVGCGFDGAALPAGRAAARAAGTAPRPAGPASAAPSAQPPLADGDRASILQRLRQQRNHATGAPP